MTTDPMVPRSFSNMPVRVISTKQIGYADAVNGPETPSTMVRVVLLSGGVFEFQCSNLEMVNDGELISEIGLEEAHSFRAKLGALLK